VVEINCVLIDGNHPLCRKRTSIWHWDCFSSIVKILNF
jgi:hypothetical protein